MMPTIHMQESIGTTSVECNKCKDTGFTIIIDELGYETIKDCECEIKKRHLKILEDSCISEAFRKKTLDNYITNNDIRKSIKKDAINYIKNFNNESFCILGQVGSGKTHITIAIANELLSMGIPVKYAQYGTMISEILAAKNDIINYHEVTNKYKNARVLLIDDLYKGATTEWNGVKKLNSRHVEIIFDIVNHRYLNNKTIITSSELTPDELSKLDEGIVSRIIEMASGYVVSITDKSMNYRFFK